LKNLIIGDVHGNFDNLFKFLMEQGAINDIGQRINTQKLNVYSVGDLLDCGKGTREGDMKILEYLERERWFNQVVIGNHEYSYLGGLDFGGVRKHDRTLASKLLELEKAGIYVPALSIDGFLVTHAGLADRWSFSTAEDAFEAINFCWENSEDDEEVAILDWIGPERAGRFANDTGGIFWLDWTEKRNTKINQIVGHSSQYDGPIKIDNPEGTVHWNVDVGGKSGYGLGGVIVENGQATPVFWGERLYWQNKQLYRVKQQEETLDTDWETAVSEDR
jgi:hypothetical protein